MRNADEWFRQARYDIETAQYMLRGGRCVYAVFMCHLAVEKALKGLYQRTVGKVPPKTHNLAFLLDQAGVTAPESIRGFLVLLNEAHIATRYPDDLAAMKKAYPKVLVQTILKRAKETMRWIGTLS